MTNNRKPNPNLPITPPNQMEGKPRPDEPLGPPDETSMYDMYGQFIMPYNQEYMDKEEGGKIVNPPEPIEQMMPEFDARQRSTMAPVLDEEDEADFTPVHPMFQAQMDLGGWQTMKKGGKVSHYKHGQSIKRGLIKDTSGGQDLVNSIYDTI